MYAFLVWTIRIMVAVLAFAGLAWVFAPKEPVDRIIAFNPNWLPGDIDAYLAAAETRYDDITPGVEKRIVWAGAPGVATPLSIVYVHGFSATSQEIRPVPDKVAAALGANLFFTRLAGHGRSGDAMAEPRAGDWLEDAAEALEIGRRIGQEVVVIATSTGGTLMAVAATDPGLFDRVKGVVMVSPNFGVNNPAAFLMELPLARYWVPLIAGKTRSFTPVNEGHARYWTTSYPTEAVFPMAALVNHALGLDYATTRVPALFLLSDQDQVVRAGTSRDVAALWGGGAQVVEVFPGPQDDPYNHVIAGDILSPGQTDSAVQTITDWIGKLAP